MKSADVKVYRNLKQGEPAQLLPFYLPDQTKNQISIKGEVHEEGERFPIVGLRNAIFMGLRPEIMTFEEPTKIHYLRDEHGVCMSSITQEMEQMTRQLERAHGSVLVGGLGLGIAVAILEQNPKVEKITVIEINRDIIDLIYPYLPHRKTAVYPDDLNMMLQGAAALGIKFDFGFFDIWRGTGEWDFSEYVFPLRRLAQGVIPQDNLEMWNEQEMIGQIQIGLTGFIQFRSTPQGKQFYENLVQNDRKAFASRYPFLQWIKQEKPSDHQALTVLSDYIKALRDPDLYDRDWEKYNHKPKERKQT